MPRRVPSGTKRVTVLPEKVWVRKSPVGEMHPLPAPRPPALSQMPRNYTWRYDDQRVVKGVVMSKHDMLVVNNAKRWVLTGFHRGRRAQRRYGCRTVVTPVPAPQGIPFPPQRELGFRQTLAMEHCKTDASGQ